MKVLLAVFTANIIFFNWLKEIRATSDKNESFSTNDPNSPTNVVRNSPFEQLQEIKKGSQSK